MMTPLHYSALICHATVCCALLDGGSDHSVQDLDDRTPLSLAVITAAMSSDLNVGSFLETLTASGADTECEDISGDTPLQVAAAFGSARIVKALLKVGANIQVENKKGRNILSCLCSTSGEPDLETIGCLLSWGCNPNSTDSEMNTALHLLLGGKATEGTSGINNTMPVMTRTRVSAAVMLVGNGAHLDLTNKYGVTAKDLALKQNINLESSFEQWKNRHPPSQSISKVCGSAEHRLPYATGPEYGNWASDEIQNCQACSSAFTFTRRKHHCRSCGQLVCGKCITKSFSLRPRTNKRNVTPIKVKVCDSCFNSLCRIVTSAASELVKKEQNQRTENSALQNLLSGNNSKNRENLFGLSSDEMKQLEQADKEKNRIPKKTVEGGIGAAAKAASQAKQSLVERGERLGVLADKTEGLENDAANFASMARKLRQQQEKKSWFGLF